MLEVFRAADRGWGTGGQMSRGPWQFGGPGRIGHKINYIISNYFLDLHA